MHSHAHSHSHSLDARRADSRRRMWWALSINLGLLVAEAIKDERKEPVPA